MKIFYTANFLAGEDYEKNVSHLFNEVVFRSIRLAGAEIEILSKNFSRKTFYELSKISNPSKSYFRFSTKISEESKNYLKQSIGNSLIFGFELEEKLKNLLSEIGVTYVNSWIHPFKLLDDLALVFESNDKEIEGKILKFSQPREKLEFYALYWKERINKSLKKLKIPENSLLLIGQSENDQSLVCGDKMLSFNDYQEEISILKSQYNIIYAPHPSNVDRFGRLTLKKRPNLKKFIKQNNPKVIIGSTYQILSSDNVVAVRAISSSVISESKYFGKDSQYLFQPLFNDSVCIMHDYFFPEFWNEILGLKPLDSLNYKIRFDSPHNKVRDMVKNGKLYWGYKNLDHLSLLMDKERMRKRTLFGRIGRISHKVFPKIF
jgi:hypothetical protein